MAAPGCGLWVVACGLWLVACGLWLVVLPEVFEAARNG